MAQKKVYLGVGHGGKDPGAVAFGRKEKDMALDIAKAARDDLVRHNVLVMLSRESDVSENLAARIRECIAFNPDLAGDIHLNAGEGDGVEVFHSKADTSDDDLARNVLNEIVKIGQNSRGLKTRVTSNGRDYFGFIRQLTVDNDIPAVLIECAFIDNKNDVKIVDTLAERRAMGVAIAKGYLKTLNIEYIEPVEEDDFFPAKGYFKKGDSGKNIEKINDFYYKVFPSYAKTLNRDKEDVKGGYFGENTEAWTKEFQRRTGLEQDGCIGPLTLAMMKKFGFKEK
ncbi:MAG: N-acetylmuramoyl-L-alanine amidase [Clostridia bacterium]|nr:N-acetylmuramoyl-L-alanine amidase [Clostridia bacterium]